MAKKGAVHSNAHRFLIIEIVYVDGRAFFVFIFQTIEMRIKQQIGELSIFYATF